MPRNTPPGTIYRRALRRVDRRSKAYISASAAEASDHGHPSWSHALAFGPCRLAADRTDHAYRLLVEASRLNNRLAVLAYGTPARAATSLLHRAIAS